MKKWSKAQTFFLAVGSVLLVLIYYVIQQEVNMNEKERNLLERGAQASRVMRDLDQMRVLANAYERVREEREENTRRKINEYYDGLITNVKFDEKNGATVCYWHDGAKTVAVCQKGDIYDKEKGLLVCIMKRVWEGNQINRIMDKWCG